MRDPVSAPLPEVSWPLSPEQVGAISGWFEQFALGEDSAMWWSESRLSNGTMTAVRRTRDRTLHEMVPGDFRLGGRVHESGAGPPHSECIRQDVVFGDI